MTRFTSRVALVTGGGHGIGAATARRLAEEGAAVAVLDLEGDAAEAVAQSLRAGGARATAVVADVSDVDALAGAVATVKAELGAISLLSTNAAVLIPGTSLDLELAQWDRTIAVNLRGAFLTTRAVLPDMLDRGDGAIVHTASVGGLFGVPALAAYNASKGAVVNYTRQLALDYTGGGVRINCVCPGWVPTGFNAPLLKSIGDEEMRTMVAETVPAGRQADPAEIAAAIAFLLSEDASYVAGHALVVDGGLTVSV